MLCLLKGANIMHLLLICRSLTTAQRAVRILQRNGIFGSVTKAPQSANPGGCTYSVKIAERNLNAALQTLEANGIRIDQILELPGPGAAL